MRGVGRVSRSSILRGWTLVVVIMALIGSVGVVHANHLVNPTAVPDDAQLGVETKYTFSGSMSTTATTGGFFHVVIVFPVGFDLSQAVPANVTICEDPTRAVCVSPPANEYSFVVRGQEARFTISGTMDDWDGLGGGLFDIEIDRIGNPIGLIWNDNLIADPMLNTAFVDGVATAWQTAYSISMGVESADNTRAAGPVPTPVNLTQGAAPTFSVSAGGLPPGLTLDATGNITGTPTQTGDFSFTIQATSGPHVVSTDFDITVKDSPAWVDSALGTIVVGEVYGDGVVASGTPSPTYSVTAGALPAGLALDAVTGALTGTPTTVESYDFTITATNEVGAIAANFTGSTGLTPVWTDEALPAFTVGMPYNDGVTASGNPAPTYSISSGTLPAGLALDTVTGAITGTPVRVEVYDFVIMASNPVGSITRQFTGSTNRTDPTTDQDVLDLLTVQSETSRRFIATQSTHVADRLRRLRATPQAPGLGGLVIDVGDAVEGDGRLIPLGGEGIAGAWSIWSSGSIDVRRQTSTGNGSFELYTDGVTLGADRNVLSDDAVLGFAVSIGRSTTDVGDSGSESNASETAGIVYSTWSRDGAEASLFVDGMLGYGLATVENRRWSSESSAFASGTRSGRQQFGTLTVGYSFKSGRWSFSPFTRYQAAHSTLGEYQETGAGLYDLTYDTQTLRMATTSLGLAGNVNIKTERGVIRPFWQGEFRATYEEGSNAGMNFREAPLAENFNVVIPGAHSRSFSFELGVDFEILTGWLMNVVYRYEDVPTNGSSGTVSLGVQRDF